MVLDIFHQVTFVIKQTKTTYKSNYKQNTIRCDRQK